MKNRLLIWLVLLAAPTICVAQTTYSLGDYSTATESVSTKMHVGLYSAVEFNSTALTWSFIRAASNGSNIETRDKGDVSDRLSAQNRFGGALHNRVSFSQQLPGIAGHQSFSLQWFAAVADRQQINGQFPEDLFQLGLYGNKTFAGDTAHLGNSTLNVLRYQQFQVGLLSNNGMGQTWGAGISYLNGEQLAMLDVAVADFYTSPIGDELAAAVQANAILSDTGNFGFATPNGWGISTDLFYRYDYRNAKGGKGAIRVEVNDLGWMRWNDKTVRYNLDSNLYWAGIVISDLDQLTDSVLSSASDSLNDQLGYRSRHKKYRHATPAVLRVTLEQDIGKTRWATGLEHRVLANYRTYLYLRGGYAITQKAEVYGIISTGGYGPWSVGLEARIGWKNILLALGARNIEGLVFPRKSGALNAWAGLQFRFG